MVDLPRAQFERVRHGRPQIGDFEIEVPRDPPSALMGRPDRRYVPVGELEAAQATPSGGSTAAPSASALAISHPSSSE
ncbi:hypothetical protein J2Z21_007337 [Streptomyces griseochromogenes]|uniref:Uncharacterized protein n=1 Tax=Streptomyces griseochromogenes TaxID=68214 RepID=A0A1B1AYD8_9ACTN|nr:hypothetical protein [Streptomyces griseochromogenes]ANP51579.1 hypothetical protein AVL59_19990 [Streptomyces griseochromogenes]MBP2054334.1 hypothetical protein [Streptomyces griseochromogenes]